MGSREKDQPTPHLSSLVVRPTDSGGENGGGGAGSDYEPGEVRRDAPPYSRSDRFSDTHGYRAHAGSVSPVRHRNADHRYSTDFDHSGGPQRSHGFGSGRDPGRHRDYSPPYGRGRHAGRFVGRSYDGPGYGGRQVRGEGLPRSNPNVRPRDGDWMCTDPLNARLAVGRLVDTLSFCVEQSLNKMKNEEEPTCLIDFWMQENLREINEAKINGLQKPFQYSNKELGGYLFDFLFAAQDASTSALLWAIVLLDSHPQVLEKVRSDVARFWSPESEEPLTAEMLREMKYLEAVAREIIRIRAPATMVPHIAGEEFRLTEDYVIPKGTIVFPSVFDSSFQGFPEPEKFEPDRFMEERQEERVYKKNFLAFGAGPHACVGQKYAINHLMLFIAMFTALIDFKRHKTDGCDDISYIPTIAPKDDCKVFLAHRCTR